MKLKIRLSMSTDMIIWILVQVIKLIKADGFQIFYDKEIPFELRLQDINGDA